MIIENSDAFCPYISDVYYISFPRDKLLPKFIVSVVYTLEVLQVILSTRDAFRTLASRWGNMRELDEVGWQWFSVILLGVLRKYCPLVLMSLF